MKYAVIDLGTNTFNLLIAEVSATKEYTLLLNTKEGVKLGEGGINQKFISEKAYQRGISAIAKHIDKIKYFGVDKIKAFATSAIRDAGNGQEFIRRLRQAFNLEVEVISGDREAELIYRGVIQTLPVSDKRYLILDIGGGSNEFIIADSSQIYWKKSYRLGMARLLERFQPSNPVKPEKIALIEAYLDTELGELHKQSNTLKPGAFIGASGSFDSFVALLASRGLLQHQPGDVFHEIPYKTYEALHEILIQSTTEERERMSELEPVRRDMIVLASIFVTFVLKKTGLKTIYQSAYSLKEGALAEMTGKIVLPPIKI